MCHIPLPLLVKFHSPEYFPKTIGCLFRATILALPGKQKKLQHDVREAAACAECSYVAKLVAKLLIPSL